MNGFFRNLLTDIFDRPHRVGIVLKSALLILTKVQKTNLLLSRIFF